MLSNFELLQIKKTGQFDLNSWESYALKISLKGSLNLNNTSEVSLFLRTLINGGARRLILDLENLVYIDSSGIGTIIQLKKAATAKLGDLVLLNVPAKITEVLNLVNLGDFIKVAYSKEKAIDFFLSV